jgi:hypothetical protein
LSEKQQLTSPDSHSLPLPRHNDHDQLQGRTKVTTVRGSRNRSNNDDDSYDDDDDDGMLDMDAITAYGLSHNGSMVLACCS